MIDVIDDKLQRLRGYDDEILDQLQESEVADEVDEQETTLEEIVRAKTVIRQRMRAAPPAPPDTNPPAPPNPRTPPETPAPPPGPRGPATPPIIPPVQPLAVPTPTFTVHSHLPKLTLRKFKGETPQEWADRLPCRQ